MDCQVIRNIRPDTSCLLSVRAQNLQRRPLYLSDSAEVFPVSKDFVHIVDHMAIMNVDWMPTDTAFREVLQALRQTVARYEIAIRSDLFQSQSERCYASLEADEAVWVQLTSSKLLSFCKVLRERPFHEYAFAGTDARLLDDREVDVCSGVDHDKVDVWVSGKLCWVAECFDT